MDTSRKYDNPNPKRTANFFSKFVLWWLKDIFWKGTKRNLEYSDVYNVLPEHESQKLGDELERNWLNEIEICRNENRKPSLLKAIAKSFAFSWILPGIAHLIQTVFTDIFVALALMLYINHFNPAIETSKLSAFFHGCALVTLASLGNSVLHHAILLNLEEGMKVRVACCSLIYRKIMRMNKVVSEHKSAGQVLNLLSNDVNRFDQLAYFIHFLWIAPIEIVCIMFIGYQLVGIPAIVGFSLLVLQTLPAQVFISKSVSKLRMEVAKNSDKRVGLINEIITGIQVIKMYAWERPYEKLVALARRKELQTVKHYMILKGCNLAVLNSSQNLTMLWIILLYSLMGNQLLSSKIFPLCNISHFMNIRIAWFVANAMQLLGEVNVTISRLQDYLLLEEIQPRKQSIIVMDVSMKNYSVMLKNVSAKWQQDSITDTLTKVSVKIKQSSLCAVVGPVGSGKSALLHVILSELPNVSGVCSVNGSIAFVAQEPWLFRGTVRQNIIFGECYNAERYQKIINLCTLKQDFEALPNGDKTVIGDRGISLSGGQKARVSLARALYKDADIYLLDDPLSAVDAQVAQQLFSDCIINYLSNKTRILVTNQYQYLKYTDWIIILNNGKIVNQGEYRNLQSNGLNHMDFIKKEKLLYEEMKPPKKRIRQISVLSDESSTVNDEAEEPDENAELLAKGPMKSVVFWKYIRSGATVCSLILLCAFLILSQALYSVAEYWIYLWTRRDEFNKINSETLNQNLSTHLRETQDVLNFGNTSVWQDTTGNFSEYLESDSVLTSTIVSENFSNLFEVTTTEAYTSSDPMIRFSSTSFNVSLDILEKGEDEFSDYMPLYIYASCSVFALIFVFLRGVFVAKVCASASKALHTNMFTSVLQACVNFFHVHSAGQVLNRFSKDAGTMDEMLPPALMDFLLLVLRMSSPVLMIVIVNYLLIVPVVFTFLLGYKIFTIYICAARDLKHIENASKSPVFNHLLSSVSGLTTIRASKAEKHLCKEFDTLQDVQTSAYYLSLASGCAFGFWMCIVTSIFLASVIFSFLIFNTNTVGPEVGYTTTQATIIMGSIVFMLTTLIAIIMSMASVERILDFSDIKREQDMWSDSGKKAPPNWPEKGLIQFDHVNLKYVDPGPLALNDINIVIKPGEKIGIVGRTGAGKSSLVSAVFRMVKFEGNILIDSIDIQTINLRDLRTRISIIPQDPLLFSTTLRKNLDPFDIIPDSQLWNALSDVEMKSAVTSLDMTLESGGSNFSIGQRQLLCMARAIVKNSKIIILDEATANVDPETDDFIQDTIRNKFKQCTVLTVAHRLNTVMEYDKIIVLDSGSVMEFDHPYLLLQNRQGYLYNLVQQTSQEMAEYLHETAEKSYKSFPTNEEPTISRKKY